MDEELLCFFEKSIGHHEAHCEIAQNIKCGNWIKNLESENDFKAFVKTGKEEFSEDVKLKLAISCLLAYIEENFTGPNLFQTANEFRFETIDDGDRWNLAELSIDGIEINSNMRNLELLLIAFNFLNDLIRDAPSDLLICIWYLRMLKVHQKSLDENSITLYDTFKKIQELLTSEKLQEIKNPRFRFLIKLEVISLHLIYRRVHKTEELIKELKDDYQIDTIEEGVMGLRTKWQQKALPQYHVSVQQNNSELFLSPQETHGDTLLMELLKLEDDTRLESIKFMDDKHNQLQNLSSISQNFVLLSTRYLEISQPKDKLSDEEIRPYLMILLRQSNGAWPIRMNALLMNIKFEANHKRTVDRSLRQCEELVTFINSKNDVSSKQRLSYIFSSLLIPRYKIEAQLADLMVSLGLIKGALDIYLKIHQWEDVINCYTRLQLRHKAAEIIQQELDRQPTAKLYCLLGDATDDISCYEKAWEFSKHKSGLAQRHFGMYFFGKNDFEKAIPHLQKSLEINSLQENLWLRLGYAALQCEKYELAASAYIRYTQLEPNGFESWNNLAKCFIKLGNKQRAHKVLQEALKCNFDNWKIWENFLMVSVDIGSFDDGLNAYNRLMELKEKYFDGEILGLLIKAISDNLIDNEGNSANRLKKKALEMLAHLGSIHQNEGIIWELSALLTTEPLKKAEKLLKAYKGFVSKSPDWNKNEEIGLMLLKLSHVICEYSLEAANDFNENEKMLVLSQLSSARLTAQGCAKVATNNQWQSCDEVSASVNNLLEKIVVKIKELK